MMYFRITGLVSSLGIRTAASSVVETYADFKGYEDSETVFHLGGPHEISVEMRNASEDELHQSNRRDLYLVCQVTGKWEPDSQEVRDAFEALSEGRVPNSTRSLEEVGQELAQARREGRIWVYNFPWDVLPPSLQDFSTQVAVELHEVVKKTAAALRWRYGILGPPFPYSSRESEFSFDGEQWHALPNRIYGSIEARPNATVHLTEQGKADTEALLSEELAEPLGHVLFREAYMLRNTSPRSALVIGVAALEAEAKRFMAEFGSAATPQNPQLVAILKNHLPNLLKEKGEGQMRPLPKTLRKNLDEAVRERNRVVHRGSSAVELAVLKEWLRAIRDVLWLLDYYRGLPWALEHVREETEESMGL